MSQLAGPATGRGARLVGRDPERERVREFAGALPDGARALLIRGEPGIGKTALWRLAIDLCAGSGFAVLRTRPAEEEMPLGLTALVDLFENARLDPAALLAEDNPFARGRAVLAALRGQAERRPAIVAIDDLQWLDHASARPLRYALRRLDGEPVGIVATVRAGPGSCWARSTRASCAPGRAARRGPGARRARWARAVAGRRRDRGGRAAGRRRGARGDRLRPSRRVPGAAGCDRGSRLRARVRGRCRRACGADAVGGPWPSAATERGRGALALAEGDGERAAEHLVRAAEMFERTGHRPDAARSRFLAGRALLRAGRRIQAADAFADARERFAAMGAVLWEARAAGELERAAPGRATGSLPRAERRVAEAVAEGMRNKEIGAKLFMRLGTVEAHLTRIYPKLWIRSRSELARLVADGDV